jgi:hypothetical protein
MERLLTLISYVYLLIPQGRRASARWLAAAGSVLTVVIVLVAVAIGVASMDSSCGWLRRCRPLS